MQPLPHVDSADAAKLGFGLDCVADGMNYYAWLASVFQPYLSGKVVEHGAGTGALSLALLKSTNHSVVLTEPTPNLVELLRRKFASHARAEVFGGTIEQYLAREGEGSAAAVISSNVLEHIGDDIACLRAIHRLVKKDGVLGLYVPARPELFGTVDSAVGHERRYRRSELRRKLEIAGFRVEDLRYRNVLSGLAWFVTGRILKKSDVGEGNIKLYDRVIFPVCRFVEDLVPPPWGQNLLAIARKA